MKSYSLCVLSFSQMVEMISFHLAHKLEEQGYGDQKIISKNHI